MIKFVLHDQTEHHVDAENGHSLMAIARRQGFSGILAECGGACSCATCHVHIAPEWMDRLPVMDDLEQDMLEFAEDVDEYSRLSCQIQISSRLEGLVVHIPESQY